MLSQRIAQKSSIRIAVIGVGYVGLPFILKLNETGFSVVGVDVNPVVLNKLSEGKSTLESISDAQVKAGLATGRLDFLMVEEEAAQNSIDQIEKLLGIDIFVVSVPTPLHKDRGWEPETRAISQAADLIAAVCEREAVNGCLPHQRLVILESTTYPGTTRKLFIGIRDRYLSKGLDCLLAYSPERTNPGPKADQDHGDVERLGKSTFDIPRIIGGLNPESSDTAATLYSSVFREVRKVSSLETAEMIKLVENTFRFISIGFANEVARVSKTFGLNAWEIIGEAKTKGFGLDLCFPGLIGGHCVPIDPHYLGWAYRNRRNVATFVDVAERSHQDAKRDALELIQRLLSYHNKGLPNASLLFFGVSYKPDVGDIRESGVLDLMKILRSYGAKITFWDPVLNAQAVRPQVIINFTETERRLLPEGIARSLVATPDSRFTYKPDEIFGTWQDVRSIVLGSAFDCIVLSTDHRDFRDAYSELISSREAPPLVDLNNATHRWLESQPISGLTSVASNERLKDRKQFMLFAFD